MLTYFILSTYVLLCFQGVHISHDAHGPALTLTIMPPSADSHHISVDLVPSLPCDISVSSQGWQQNAYSSDVIEKVENVGTHLVPKDVLFFDTSYSKAERALMEAIGSGDTCHKMCHQVIKKYVKNFISNTPGKGLSTHIFKVSLRLDVSRLMEEKRGDMVFTSPSFNPPIHPSFCPPSSSRCLGHDLKMCILFGLFIITFSTK